MMKLYWLRVKYSATLRKVQLDIMESYPCSREVKGNMLLVSGSRICLIMILLYPYIQDPEHERNLDKLCLIISDCSLLRERNAEFGKDVGTYEIGIHISQLHSQML